MSIHAKLTPEVIEQLRQQRRNSTISSVVVSILVVVLIALVLGIYLLPNIIKETPVIVTYAASVDEAKEVPEKKVTTKVMRKPSSPTSSMAKVIAANTQSAVSVPVPDQITSAPSLDFGDGDDFGSGWGDGNGTGGGGGSLFGRQINSSNLGVILDISGSAHAYLAEAIAEIDKSFPTAHIVLVVGCGMSDGNLSVSGGGKVPGRPRIVDYQKMDSERKHNSLARSGPAQLELFYKKIGSKRSRELKEHFKKRDNLYLLYGGDVMATQYAFDHVLQRNVDTIYWFADFADKTDSSVIERLGKKLRFNKVTLISHNFLGKPVGKLAKEMTLKTGGSVIEKIPGKK
ncbi:MAG: hypothetical protein RLZZ505_346 [Verrucomicrobiota bacterium]|jgi:hypothetical protein